MNINSNETSVTKRPITLWLTLGLYYFIFILIISLKQIRNINFKLGEVCSIILNIGIFALIIILIAMIPILIIYKNNKKILINELLLISIGISLVITAYILGRMY